VNGKPLHADWDHYIQFMKTQLTELLTQYGPIGVYGLTENGKDLTPTGIWTRFMRLFIVCNLKL